VEKIERPDNGAGTTAADKNGLSNLIPVCNATPQDRKNYQKNRPHRRQRTDLNTAKSEVMAV
jgi:hypothetical protein